MNFTSTVFTRSCNLQHFYIFLSNLFQLSSKNGFQKHYCQCVLPGLDPGTSPTTYRVLLLLPENVKRFEKE